MTQIAPSNKPPVLEFGSDSSKPAKWFARFPLWSSANVGTQLNGDMVDNILQHAVKLPKPRGGGSDEMVGGPSQYEPKKPVLDNTITDEVLRQQIYREDTADHRKEIKRLAQANKAAVAIILACIPEGSVLHNKLNLHPEYKKEITGTRLPHKIIEIIIQVAIINRGGKESVRAKYERQEEAKARFDNLKFSPTITLEANIANFLVLAEELHFHECPIGDEQKMAVQLMKKVKHLDIYVPIIHMIEQEMLPYPADMQALYNRLQKVVVDKTTLAPGMKSSSADSGRYVLATTVTLQQQVAPKPDKSKMTRQEREAHFEATYGKKMIPPAEWSKLTAQERKAINTENADILRLKRKRDDNKSKDAKSKKGSGRDTTTKVLALTKHDDAGVSDDDFDIHDPDAKYALSTIVSRPASNTDNADDDIMDKEDWSDSEEVPQDFLSRSQPNQKSLTNNLARYDKAVRVVGGGETDSTTTTTTWQQTYDEQDPDNNSDADSDDDNEEYFDSSEDEIPRRSTTNTVPPALVASSASNRHLTHRKVTSLEHPLQQHNTQVMPVPDQQQQLPDTTALLIIGFLICVILMLIVTVVYVQLIPAAATHYSGGVSATTSVVVAALSVRGGQQGGSSTTARPRLSLQHQRDDAAVGYSNKGSIVIRYHKYALTTSGTTPSYSPFNRDFLVHDSGAENHVCMHVPLANNIRPCRPGTLGGISSSDDTTSLALRFNKKCSLLHPRLTDAVLCTGAVANIVSPALAIDQGFTQEYLQNEDVYRLSHESGEGPVMRFGRALLTNGHRSMLYMMDTRTYDVPDSTLPRPSNALKVAITVAENKARYTKKQVAGADKALRYLDCIGHPPERSAIAQLRGSLNPPVTVADIKACFDIYGKQMSSVKATAVKKTTPAARTDTIPASVVPIRLTMEVDIIFWKKRPFLLGILLPIDYAMGFPLADIGGRKAANIAYGVAQFLAKAKSRKFVVDSISSDNEGGLAKYTTAQDLQNEGIEVFFTGAGQHCPHIERRARWVKEKSRTSEHRVQYALNNILLDWCILGSIRQTNLFITASSTARISPREKFLGRQFDWKKDGRYPFGTYVQMTTRDTDNSAAARSEGSIILMPRDNLTGSMWCYHIATRRIVVRDHFIELPMNDMIIKYMDDLAAKDGHTRGSEPFQDSECGVPPDDDDSPEIIASEQPSIASPPVVTSNTPPSWWEYGNRLAHGSESSKAAARAQFGEGVTIRGAMHTTAGAPPTTTSRSTIEVRDVEYEGHDPFADDDQDDTASQVITDNTTTPAAVTTLPAAAAATTVHTQQPQQQQHTRGDFLATLPQLPVPPAPSRGIQVRGGGATGQSRGANQSNSLASLHTNIVKQGGRQVNYTEVGTDFTDPIFESKFKAQLHHTRHWHDRTFALTISWQRAIKTYGEPAARSIRDELQQMIDKNVWHPMSFKDMTKKQRQAAIRAKMFLTEKYFPNGIFDKIKARLVARGDMQDKSLYEDSDTSAPTVELSSVLSVAAIAACESRYVATCDIGGAFLNADMFKGSGRKVIVKLDKHITKMLTKLKPDYESFVGDDGELFVELDKAMYGCIESARLWFEHLRNVLVNDMGFSQNVYDQCTFNKTDDTGFQVTIVLHVDDMLITCANKCTLEWVLTTLALKFPETKVNYGPCVPFLGMDMDFTAPGDVRITMHGAEADIIATAGDIGDHKTSSPALETLFVVNQSHEPVGQEEQDWFRSNVAKLLYLGKRSRPEILTATSFLATRAGKADTDDLAKLRRVLRYIRDSPNRGIRLSPGAHGVSVRAYVDAAYGVHMDGKSHTGMSIMLGSAGPIFVRSAKQSIVAKSSTESELIATSDSANQVFHVRNFIIAQGHRDQPATIFQDNLSCMALMAKGKSTSMRTRHIQIRYFWVKERVDNGEAVVTHMCSEAMGPANALTKPLVGSQFVEERQQLTNWD